MTEQQAVPVFYHVTPLFAAMARGDIRPGDEVACGYCPWMGVSTKWPPHLLACPDQTATK